MAKQGTDFEKFTKELYEELLKQEDLKNLKVEHDISIEGLTGQKHQIDVYWEFEVAGLIHKVAVECKDYKSPVSVGKIRDFHSALEDIGGITGIFITTVGYQAGAIQYAKGKRISLKTIKSSEITTEDFKGSGLITEIHSNFTALMIENVRQDFELDIPYIIKTLNGENLEVNIECSDDEIQIQNDNKENLYSLHDLINQLPREPVDTQNLTYKHDFSNEIHYLDYPGNSIDIKLNGITFTYDTRTYSDNFVFTAEATAKAIIRDILDGTCLVIGVERIN